MRISILCAMSVVLLAAMLLPEADAWVRVRARFRARIRVRFGKRNIPAIGRDCPFTCKLYCPGDSCNVVCANACTLKTKDQENEALKPFPHAFKTYDQDTDGFITLQEFADHLQADGESSAAALRLADDNADGKLDEKEFDEAPYSKMEQDEVAQEAVRDFVEPEPNVD